MQFVQMEFGSRFEGLKVRRLFPTFMLSLSKHVDRMVITVRRSSPGPGVVTQKLPAGSPGSWIASAPEKRAPDSGIRCRLPAALGRDRRYTVRGAASPRPRTDVIHGTTPAKGG
jgi:hypothetical protein